ncbi:hypothetical protein F5Y05DRAFT_420085 [Hypoxylon sp. FL0543]|nr:hypothetical protein F5Y05DRAFT_420085 [Hypoxylon sp. FL0543]
MSLSPWQLCFHADLKCRVTYCNNKRLISNTVSSPYCRHHCCTVCLKYKTCFKRGHGSERICHHRKLLSSLYPQPPIRREEGGIQREKIAAANTSSRAEGAGARERGSIRSSGTAPNVGLSLSPLALPLHDGCGYESCREPRSRKHPNSPYCARHACSVKDCDKPRDGPGLCCRKHTCQNRNCLNCVHGDCASSHRPSGSRRYCHGHQVCEVDECEQLVFIDGSNRAAKYCFRHYCAPSPGCAGQRVEGEGAQGCRDHTCALYPTCTNPRVDPVRGLFCEDHECTDVGCRKQKYDSGGVTGAAARTGIWCADHMCMAALTRREDCINRREGSATNPLYCADHELCEEVECTNFRAVRGRNRLQTRCEELRRVPPL